VTIRRGVPGIESARLEESRDFYVNVMHHLPGATAGGPGGREETT
jgi:hypothetical protein